MNEDIKDAPALGLYLALTWLAVLLLPKALWTEGLQTYWVELRDCWKTAGGRHG